MDLTRSQKEDEVSNNCSVMLMREFHLQKSQQLPFSVARFYLGKLTENGQEWPAAPESSFTAVFS